MIRAGNEALVGYWLDLTAGQNGLAAIPAAVTAISLAMVSARTSAWKSFAARAASKVALALTTELLASDDPGDGENVLQRLYLALFPAKGFAYFVGQRCRAAHDQGRG
jgi:hypothetical protein